MEKISINLLPFEFREQQFKRAKFVKIQAIGVVIILIMIFLSSMTIALRIIQSHNIQQVQAQASEAEEQVSKFKDTQAALVLLKNRLTVINQYSGMPSKQAAVYKLVNQLLPLSFTVSSISVDKAGVILLSAVTNDGQAIDEFIARLTEKETNDNKISKVSVDNLSRGKDGIYRVNLKIEPN